MTKSINKLTAPRVASRSATSSRGTYGTLSPRAKAIIARTRAAQKAIDDFTGDHRDRRNLLPPPKSKTMPKPERLCRFCHEPGHIYNDCPERKKELADLVAEEKSSKLSGDNR